MYMQKQVQNKLNLNEEMRFVEKTCILPVLDILWHVCPPCNWMQMWAQATLKLTACAL